MSPKYLLGLFLAVVLLATCSLADEVEGYGHGHGKPPYHKPPHYKHKPPHEEEVIPGRKLKTVELGESKEEEPQPHKPGPQPHKPAPVDEPLPHPRPHPHPPKDKPPHQGTHLLEHDDAVSTEGYHKPPYKHMPPYKKHPPTAEEEVSTSGYKKRPPYSHGRPPYKKKPPTD